MPISLLKRVLPYEFLLFNHHLISTLVIYFTWRHLPVESLFPRLYLYIILGVFALSFILQTGVTLHRTHFRFTWARVSYDSGVIKMTLHLRKPLTVKPGQYINLWTWATPFSLIQRHPFTVISCSGDPQTQLELVFKPHRGLTGSLVDLLTYGDTTIITSFTGPHGGGIPVDKFDNVLLVATGSGIIAMLPFLGSLIHDQRTYRSCTRRVHLVWQIDDLGKVARYQCKCSRIHRS